MISSDRIASGILTSSGGDARNGSSIHQTCIIAVDIRKRNEVRGSASSLHRGPSGIVDVESSNRSALDTIEMSSQVANEGGGQSDPMKSKKKDDKIFITNPLHNNKSGGGYPVENILNKAHLNGGK